MPDQNANDQTMKNQTALLSFVDNLIKDRKDPTVTEKNIPQVREVLLNEINKNINDRTVSLLSGEEQKEMDGMLDNNATDQEIDAYFEKKIPNLQSEIATVFLNFRAAYLYKPEEQKPVEKSDELENLPPAPIAG